MPSIKTLSLQLINRILLQRSRRPHSSKQPASSITSASDILVIRLDGIGDAVMTSPFLRELRHNCPNAKITLVVTRELENLFQHCPYIDTVIGIDTQRQTSLRQLGAYLEAKKVATEQLKDTRFDWVLLPRWDCELWEAAYLALMSGAPQQAAYSENCTPAKALYNKGHDDYFTHVITGDPCHEIDHNLHILKSLGLVIDSNEVEAWLDETAKQAATRWLGDRPSVIALCPGAARASKRWPLDRFSTLVDELLENYPKHNIVILGGKMEQKAGRLLTTTRSERVLDLTGKTTLIETTALLEKCDLCIGNDTGALHIAAAVGTPQIMICSFSKQGSPDQLNAPARFAPRNQTTILQPETPLPPCEGSCLSADEHCITQITPPDILTAIRSHINPTYTE